jgi:hypothetical protein
MKNNPRVSSYILAACAAVGLAQADPAAVSLFDGQTLKGWRGMEGIWRVENGAIVGETTQPKQLPFNTFLIWEGGEVADFDLTFEYKVEGQGGNSGVQYRSYAIANTDPKNCRLSGYQSDIDQGPSYTGIIYSENERGILAERGQSCVVDATHKPQLKETFGQAAELQKSIKTDDWNTYRVVAQGYKITNYVNGVKMAEIDDQDPEKRRSSGLLGFQVHRLDGTMKIQIKNILLKQLTASSNAQSAEEKK